jgi:hypothetical protein
MTKDKVLEVIASYANYLAEKYPKPLVHNKLLVDVLNSTELLKFLSDPKVTSEVLSGIFGWNEPRISERAPTDIKGPSREAVKRHKNYMVDKINEFYREGREEKASRWYGFIAACQMYEECSDPLSFPNSLLRDEVRKLAGRLSDVPMRIAVLEEKNVVAAHALLGHIQGLLWVSGEFSIDELKDANRPK